MGSNNESLTPNLVFNPTTAAATLSQMRLFQVRIRHAMNNRRTQTIQAGLTNPLWNPSLASLYYNNDHLLQLQQRIALGSESSALQQERIINKTSKHVTALTVDYSQTQLLLQSFQQQQQNQSVIPPTSSHMSNHFKSKSLTAVTVASTTSINRQ